MKNLFKSIAGFQNECPAIGKTTKAYNYKYADLPTILEIIKPLLKKYNLGFTQLIETSENKIGVKTILFETESGEKIETLVFSDIPDFKGMTKIQSLGSIITYLRRYTLSAILGIITEEDNDGNYNHGEKQEKPIEKPFCDEVNFKKLLNSKDLKVIENYCSKVQFTKEQNVELNKYLLILKK